MPLPRRALRQLSARLSDGKAFSTVRHELNIISQVYELELDRHNAAYYDLRLSHALIHAAQTLTRRLDRVARETEAPAEMLVRDAIKGHLNYLEWLGQSLDDAETGRAGRLVRH